MNRYGTPNWSGAISIQTFSSFCQVRNSPGISFASLITSANGFGPVAAAAAALAACATVAGDAPGRALATLPAATPAATAAATFVASVAGCAAAPLPTNPALRAGVAQPPSARQAPATPAA